MSVVNAEIYHFFLFLKEAEQRRYIMSSGHAHFLGMTIDAWSTIHGRNRADVFPVPAACSNRREGLTCFQYG